MRSTIAICIVALTATAHAEDTFETKAKGAITVRGLDDVVWALTAACDKGDELHQRQCRLIRDAFQYTGTTMLVEAEPSAFTVGAWDPGKRSVPLSLTGCIRCGGVPVDGRLWHLTAAQAKFKVEGGKISTGLLYDNAKQFPDAARANAWIASVKNARVQMVVRIPEKRRWSVSGKDGLLFELLAYRVVQACSGEVIISDLKAGPAERDKTACTTGTPAPGGGQAQVVEELTRDMVREAMQPVVQGAKACYAKFKQAGKARLDIGIASDGSVASYAQSGDFKGSPMGQCIDTAVGNLQFPPSQKPITTIGFPIAVP